MGASLTKKKQTDNNSTAYKSSKPFHSCDEARADDDQSFEKVDPLYQQDESHTAKPANPNNDTISEALKDEENEKSLGSYDWFMGVLSRKESERLLLTPGNEVGCFLIREVAETGVFVLSMTDFEETKGDTVKHYKINIKDNNQGYYITDKRVMTSLKELINYYSSQSSGLCRKLTKPCLKSIPFTGLNEDSWETPRESLEFSAKLGTGDFGEVWRGKWKEMTDVAIKVIKSEAISEYTVLEEANIMKQYTHYKLLRLYALCTDIKPIYIVTEFMSKGNLLNYLRDDDGQNLKFPQLLDFATQIASGMSFLEEKGLFHGHLNARKIFVGDNNNVKVGCFCLFRLPDDDYEEEYQRKAIASRIKWNAPEAALYGRFTIKSDVWSYGILLVEVITYGKVPYPGLCNLEVLDKVDKGYRHPKPEGCPDPMYEMMLKCWNKKMANRPTFEYLFNYFDNYFIESEQQGHPLSF